MSSHKAPLVCNLQRFRSEISDQFVLFFPAAESAHTVNRSGQQGAGVKTATGQALGSLGSGEISTWRFVTDFKWVLSCPVLT